MTVCAMYFPFLCVHVFVLSVSLGCPLSLLTLCSGSPSATSTRTGAACCTSNSTDGPPSPLALQQRRQDAETERYLPTESSVCVYVCVWQEFKSLYSSCLCWHEEGNMRRVLHRALWKKVCLFSIKYSPPVGLKGNC